MKLINLPDAHFEEMDALLIKDTKPIECILKLNSSYACTAANKNGAFNLWIDTDQYYRGELMKHYIIKDTIKTYNLDKFIERVEEWFEVIK